MKLTTPQYEHLLDRTTDAMRESALLWLVFALLDRAVGGNFTFRWAAWNAIACVAIWLIGIYIELRKR